MDARLRQLQRDAMRGNPSAQAELERRVTQLLGESPPGELNPQDAWRFMHEGNAILTVANETSGRRFTFRLTEGKLKDKTLFVRVLSGPDNYVNYSLIGKVDGFTFTPAQSPDLHQPSIKAFAWLYRTLAKVNHQGTWLDWPKPVKLFHVGRCGRCGRRLTVPESIRSGIGPECIKLGRDAPPWAKGLLGGKL